MAIRFPHRDDEGLAWLAFAYAVDELDAEASAAFESRLEGDQSAREALAEAVLIAEAVSVAARTDHEAGRRRRRRLVFAGITTVAAAASLLIAVSSWRSPAQSTSSVTMNQSLYPPPGDTASGEAVALAWSGLRHETESSNPIEGDELNDPLEESDGSIPPWLLEAAALPTQSETGQGS